MLFKRGDIARLAGVSTATVLYVINDVLRSVTQETQRSVMRAIEERHYLPGAIGRSLVTKTDFNRLQQTSSVSSFRTFPSRFTPRWPGLSSKLWKPLTTASPSGTTTSDPMVERECRAKLLSKEVDGIGLTPAGPNDDQLCVRWAGYWRDS